MRKLVEFKDPHSSAIYRRLPKRGLPTGLGDLRVRDGDLVVFRMTTYPAGKEGQIEHAQEHAEFGRAFASVLCDGAGVAYEAGKELALIALSSNVKFGYLRFISMRSVCHVLPYDAPFHRWFFSGHCGFDNASTLLRLIQHGSFNDRTMTAERMVRSTDATLRPSRGCYCYPSVIPGTWIPQCLHDFELWLTSVGALQENGEPTTREGFSFLASRFLRAYRHLAEERVRVEGHAENLERYSRRKRKDAQSGTTQGIAASTTDGK